MKGKGERGPVPKKEVVEADSLQVHGRELIPLVRVTNRARRRASLHKDGLTGSGYGFVHMRPIAILDKERDGKRHPIHNQTARMIGGLILFAFLIPWLSGLLVLLCRRSQGKSSPRSSA